MKCPENEQELDDLLAQPYQQCIDMMRRLKGDIMILGIAGKMGITLGLMAKRAIEAAGVDKKVYGVARFSNPAARDQLTAAGIECFSCDLLDRQAVASLPAVENILYMAGRKFGTDGSEHVTWAMNAMVPYNVIEHFTNARIVAFSTGCVYPLVTREEGPCDEDQAPAPIGEYAQSCLARERIFQFAAKERHIPVCLYRLNYAIDLRYGVLHDIAQQILQGEAVNDSVPYTNIIWQGDANNHALLCLEHCSCPANIMNVTGPEILATRDLATSLAQHLNKPLNFTGQEQERSYLNDAARAIHEFGACTIKPETLIEWQAQWLSAGNASLGKPTHFEVNTGSF